MVCLVVVIFALGNREGLPQDLQGHQMRFLDRIMGWVSLVAHGGRAC